MEAVIYSTFRNHLKDYMKKVNDEFEPLAVVNKNPDEDIVVVSKSEWDSIQETLRIVQNKELSQGFKRNGSGTCWRDSRTCTKGVENVTHFH